MSRSRSEHEVHPSHLVLAGQSVKAISVGGIETCFQLSGFDCNLDIGRCPPGAIGQSRLLLTHAHMDHAAGLPYYVSMRAMQRLRPPRVHCPVEVEPTLRRILEAWASLDSDADRCHLEGVSPGDRIPLGGDAHARVFRSVHRVPTVGYALFRSRRKLKPQLHGLDGGRLRDLARAGEDLHEVEDRCELCFCGDTAAETLDREPVTRTARVLMLECTFLGERPGREQARAGGHVHLDDIADRADVLENEAILLTHFSRRYAPAAIRRAVDDRLPPGLRERVHLLIDA